VAGSNVSAFERWCPGASAQTSLPALLCLAGAGGCPSEFRSWSEAMSGQTQVIPIALPGRERRIRETPYEVLPDLITELTAEAAPALARPFALFGYSLGALVMYELARMLPPDHQRNLLHLFVGGQAAPSWRQTDRARSCHSDDELIAYLRALGGTPDEILNSRTFMRPYLACLRADLALADGYLYAGPARLSCPLTVFAGRRDPATDPTSLPAWAQETHGAFRFVQLPGGHFSLRTDRDLVIAEIARSLQVSSAITSEPL
jgi:medium-chain acyl-[acyl-carrier-protein] hydrolase